MTTNDAFGDSGHSDDVWHFSFERGHAVNNGETNTGDFVVVAASLTYPASR